jgi:hypothetical protein
MSRNSRASPATQQGKTAGRGSSSQSSGNRASGQGSNHSQIKSNSQIKKGWKSPQNLAFILIYCGFGFGLFAILIYLAYRSIVSQTKKKE